MNNHCKILLNYTPPICKPPLATLMTYSYTFKDFVAVGLPINTIMLVASAIMLKLVFFM